jgi:hypothetical protein
MACMQTNYWFKTRNSIVVYLHAKEMPFFFNPPFIQLPGALKRIDVNLINQQVMAPKKPQFVFRSKNSLIDPELLVDADWRSRNACVRMDQLK